MIKDDSSFTEAENLAKEIPLLIDRLHQEYQKYFTGAEKKPPLLLREQLDKKIGRLQTLARQITNSSEQFRSQTALSKFNTYKTLWEKKMIEKEKTR